MAQRRRRKAEEAERRREARGGSKAEKAGDKEPRTKKKLRTPLGQHYYYQHPWSCSALTHIGYE